MDGARRRNATMAGMAAFGIAALVGCSSTVSSGASIAGSEGAAAVAPMELASVAVAPPTTDAPVPTTPPTTAAPSTTAASTAAPPTTAPPTTAASLVVPSNEVAIAPLEPALAAIGSSSGAEAARLQQRLLDAGFWVSGVDGQYGLTTRQAVMAFEKYMGLEADGKLDQRTADELSALTIRAKARANSGTLVEVDKARQVLFFVVDGKTEWVLNTSTGNGQAYTEEDKNTPGETISGVALTPDGLHEVNRERPDGWWAGDLGEIYRPKYFVGGVAVHGSNSIPNYPASHGCVRVSVPAMDWVWESGIMPIETPVWVHAD